MSEVTTNGALATWLREQMQAGNRYLLVVVPNAPQRRAATDTLRWALGRSLASFEQPGWMLTVLDGTTIRVITYATPPEYLQGLLIDAAYWVDWSTAPPPYLAALVAQRVATTPRLV